MRALITKSWVFNAAQTNVLLEPVAGDKRMAIVYVKAKASNQNSAAPEVRIGFAAATLPAIVANSADGMPGMCVDDGGVARGGGEISTSPIAIGIGDYGIGPRLTCGIPTGGDLRIVMAWYLLD